MRKFKKPHLVLATMLLIGIPVVAVGLFTRLNPSDCTEAERFDVLTGSCYYNCTSSQDCADKAKAVDDQLNSFFEGAQTKVTKQSDTHAAPLPPSTNDGTKLLTKAFTGSETDGTIYAVTKKLTLVPTPTSSDKELWDLFSRVVGQADLLRYIQSFEVFNDPDNDSAASVWQSQTLGKWHVNVNGSFKDDKKDIVHTMVHEYGHIVSLNSTQIKGDSDGACPYLRLGEGCANQGSYINAFYDKYWSKYGANAPANEGQDTNEVSAFYNQRQLAFVSEYAATNYGEDWAESWATFVTTGKPSGALKKDKKVLFFYGYAPLQSTRDRIRVQIASCRCI